MKSPCLIVCGLLATRISLAQPGADPAPPYGSPPPYQPPPPQYGPPPPVYAQPSQPQGPQPGGARTTFISTTEKRWDVRIDSNAVCTTPCSLYVEPGRFVTMHLQDLPRSKLSVGYIPPGDFVVTAKPRDPAGFAVGVTFTSLGGAAVITGITLTAVGSGTNNSAMRTAGLITGLGGLAVTAYAIPMIKRSLPTASIGPAQGQPYVNGQTAGIAGSF